MAGLCAIAEYGIQNPEFGIAPFGCTSFLLGTAIARKRQAPVSASEREKLAHRVNLEFRMEGSSLSITALMIRRALFWILNSVFCIPIKSAKNSHIA
jgi:hypothetical protein